MLVYDSLCQERTAAAEADLKKRYDKAKYPLVALADEVALNTDWSGRDDWEEELLEQHFFGTAIAGEEFYNRLQEVGPEEDDLAEIYFLCLSLGFQGGYRSRAGERRSLQQSLYSRLGDRVSKKSDKMCPQAYEHTVERDMTKLPAVSAAYIGAVLVGAVLLAFFASNIVTGEILEKLQELAASIVSEGR